MFKTYKEKVRNHSKCRVLLETEHYFIFSFNDTKVHIELNEDTDYEKVVGTIKYHLREQKDDVS